MRLDEPSAKTMCHSIYVGAAWRDCSAGAAALAAALTLAEREEISRGIASRLVDSWDSQRSAAGGVDSEPRGRPPWRATSVSSQ